MITLTLQQAKAKLNNLVDRAVAGEQVVLLRGSRIVATILPLSENDLEISSRLTDRQAEHFWQEVFDDKKSEKFKSAKAAIGFLKKDLVKK